MQHPKIMTVFLSTKKKYTFSIPQTPGYYVFKNKRSGTKYFSDAFTLRIRIGVILEVLGEMSLTD